MIVASHLPEVTLSPTLRLLTERDLPALEAFLLAHTDTSMFLRSNLRRAGLAFHGQPYEATWAGAFEAGEVTAVAAHAWSGNLLLQAPVHATALTRAVLSASARPLAGLIGPWEQVQQVRSSPLLRTEPTAMADAEVLFSLSLPDLVVPRQLEEGHWRWRHATMAEVERCVLWRVEYCVEALSQEDSRELRAEARQSVTQLISARELYLLEADGAVVACSAFNATLPDCVQVGGVYTPPALRGHGYARAVVAGSLLDSRARGVSRAILFTGGNNLAAQRAYKALGFRESGNYGLIFFTRPVRVS